MRLDKVSFLSFLTLLIIFLVSGFSHVALSQPPDGTSETAWQETKAIALRSQAQTRPAETRSGEQTLLQVEGVLAEGSLVLPQDGSLYNEHTFEGRAGQSVAIDLESDEFDTFLILLDPEEQVVEQHDDVSQGNLNSTLNVTLPVDGTYTVIANGFDSSSRGRYRLTVRTPTQSSNRPR
jgi:hypothetical protein